MDPKLDNILKLVVAAALKHPELADELRKKLPTTTSSANSAMIIQIGNDVKQIRNLLSIDADVSIDYSFIPDKNTRNQLIIDNLRMENAAYDLKVSEIERFFSSCVSAFHQIENMLNYFYHTKYPNINDLLDELEDATYGDKYPFIRKSDIEYKSVADVAISSKVNAYILRYMSYSKYIASNVASLRKIRNEGAHRCSVLYEKETDGLDNSVKNFLRYNGTMEQLRNIVDEFAKSIACEL